MNRLRKIIFTILLLWILNPIINVHAITSNTSVNGSASAIPIRVYLILEDDALVPEFEFQYDIVGIPNTIPASTNQEEVLAPEVYQIPFIYNQTFQTSDYQANQIKDTTGHPITLEDNQSYLLRYTTLNFSAVTFTKPGNYRYILTQKVGNYDGLTFDTEHKYYVDVIVISDETGNLSISEYTIRPYSDDTRVNVGEANKLEYGYFVNVYNTNDLIFTNNVTGNQIDHTNTYDYQVLVTSADTNKSYKYIITKDDNSTVTGYLDSGTPVTLTIKENESVKVYGLSANDSYSITAEDKTNTGYSTSYTEVVFSNGSSETSDVIESFNASGNLDNPIRIDYLYTKNIAAKTGVIINVIPYILMITIGLTTIKYLNKKKN